ncbi:MAG TPA: SRPBCC domain-containing protein [Bryobacteraceae bacterium]|nr:SRPBCC domain-containing protein [Bryobacteraceae bacterium]
MSGLTRRQLAIGASVATCVGTLAIRAGADIDDGISRTAEAIHQEPVFAASRRRVYEALMDPTQFDRIVQLSAAMQTMTAGNTPCEIGRQPGSAFSVFHGHILGRQIELIADERIVQAWRVADWSPGVYSIARFQFTQEGSNTRVILDHTGFPAGKAQHLADGWKANYWEPLQKYLRT